MNNGENKPINFVLLERKALLGKYAGKTVLQAVPTSRDRVSFSKLCHQISKNTTVNRQEVQAVLSMAFEVAKEHVENGSIVDLGEFGSLTPSFKSQQVLKTDKGADAFDVALHITKPTVRLNPSRKYFTLEGVRFQRVDPSADARKNIHTEQGGGKPRGGGSQGGRGEDLGI